MNTELAMVLRMLDEAFLLKTWHGPNLRGSIRGVTAEEATWRPGKRRHNAWEIVVHAAYWKYAVRRRLLGEKRGTFALTGNNWFVRPVEGRSWRDDIVLLESEHRHLRDAIAGLPPDRLDSIAQGGKVTVRAILMGIAFHDIYHAGQIQLLKRLYQGKKR